MLKWDSGLMVEISYIVDFILLNLLFVLFCIPVVTIGAAMTARFYVSMKLIRGEEPAVWKSFLKSFKENFKQSTVAWIFSAALLLFFSWDWFLILQNKQGTQISVFQILLLFVSVLTCMTVYSVFAFIARFQTTTLEAFKGAVLFSILHFPRMLLAMVILIAPYFIGIWYMNWFLGIWLLLSTVEVYYNSRMYVKGFQKIEQKFIKEPETEEKE